MVAFDVDSRSFVCQSSQTAAPIFASETSTHGHPAAGFRHGAQHESVKPLATRGQVEGTKVSLMFRIYDRPGALVDVLTILGKYGISLTRIESKPSKST